MLLEIYKKYFENMIKFQFKTQFGLSFMYRNEFTFNFFTLKLIQ